MRTHPRATRAAFRRAVWASAALHAAVAVSVVVLARADRSPPEPPAQTIDNRAPLVQMYSTETAEPVEVHPPEPPTPASPATPTPSDPPTPTPVQPPEPASVAPGGPFAPRPPRTLPPDLAARVRQASASAASGPTHDPNVKPAAAAPAAGLALHGALKPGQAAVYLLDASGSMGAGGKFARAQAALAATLAGQPEGVRFQVFVYDWSAWPLAPGVTIPATPAGVRAVTAQLAAVEPRGRSNHLVALRAALDARPDVVVWLTDADDLSAAALAPVRRAAGRHIPVYVGLVTAERVEQPRELK